MFRPSPLGAALFGITSGLSASAVQSLFIRATHKFEPHEHPDGFVPPESQQRDERFTETVARRTVEGLAQRGPLSDKARAGKVVHYAFGGAWGMGYGLLASTFPAMATVLGGAAYGLGVWAASDNVVLPVFRLAAWPREYAAKTYAYAVTAHLVYGVALAGSYALMTRVRGPLVVLFAGTWAARRVSKVARSGVRRVATRVARIGWRAREMVRAA